LLRYRNMQSFSFIVVSLILPFNLYGMDAASSDDLAECASSNKEPPSLTVGEVAQSLYDHSLAPPKIPPKKLDNGFCTAVGISGVIGGVFGLIMGSATCPQAFEPSGCTNATTTSCGLFSSSVAAPVCYLTLSLVAVPIVTLTTWGLVRLFFSYRYRRAVKDSEHEAQVVAQQFKRGRDDKDPIDDQDISFVPMLLSRAPELLSKLNITQALRLATSNFETFEQVIESSSKFPESFKEKWTTTSNKALDSFTTKLQICRRFGLSKTHRELLDRLTYALNGIELTKKPVFKKLAALTPAELDEVRTYFNPGNFRRKLKNFEFLRWSWEQAKNFEFLKKIIVDFCADEDNQMTVVNAWLKMPDDLERALISH